MNSKDIREQQIFLNCYKTLTDEQKLKLEELSFRSMIMSCLTYGDNIFTSISMWTGKPYADEYIDILGYEKAMEIYNDQKRYFDECCTVEKDVYTDSEGVTYNRLIEK